MTVTTSCYCCKRTIDVALDIFECREFATCRDAGRACPERPRITPAGAR